ncbi:hypothetical protein cyc_02826 [Cyclospora cayetanensis]|uniref:WD domain, G-beta repeat-containing protein n=1 Tax=Cyclospora cayetanensis TaxID=88456 RepID=A0A1D3D315_9EIME|nr:hypothetical protein cyc_02826 [Cyclospora cayetanensis]
MHGKKRQRLLALADHHEGPQEAQLPVEGPQKPSFPQLILALGTYEGGLVGYRVDASHLIGPSSCSFKDASECQESEEGIQRIFAVNAHAGCVTALCSVGRFLVSGSTDETLKRTGDWQLLKTIQTRQNTQEKRQKKAVLSGAAAASQVVVHASCKLALCLNGSRALLLLDLMRGVCTARFELDEGPLSVSWSPCGTSFGVLFAKKILTKELAKAEAASGDSCVVGAPPTTTPTPQAAWSAFCFGEDKHTLFAGTSLGGVHCFSLLEGAPSRAAAVTTKAAQTLKRRPSCSPNASAAEDAAGGGNIRETALLVSPHKTRIKALSYFCKDARESSKGCLFSADSSGTVAIWTFERAAAIKNATALNPQANKDGGKRNEKGDATLPQIEPIRVIHTGCRVTRLVVMEVCKGKSTLGNRRLVGEGGHAESGEHSKDEEAPGRHAAMEAQRNAMSICGDRVGSTAGACAEDVKEEQTAKQEKQDEVYASRFVIDGASRGSSSAIPPIRIRRASTAPTQARGFALPLGLVAPARPAGRSGFGGLSASSPFGGLRDRPLGASLVGSLEHAPRQDLAFDSEGEAEGAPEAGSLASFISRTSSRGSGVGRNHRFAFSLASAASTRLLAEADELQAAAGPAWQEGSPAPPQGASSSRGEAPQVRAVLGEGLPRLLDLEIWELFEGVEKENDVESLRKRLGALGFWFYKDYHHQQKALLQEAISTQQLKDLAAAKKERDGLLEELYCLRRSLGTANAALAEAERRNKDAPNEDTTHPDMKLLSSELSSLKTERDDLIGRLYHQQQKNQELTTQLTEATATCKEHEQQLQQLKQQMETVSTERQQLQSQLIQYKIKYAESAYEELGARQGALQRTLTGVSLQGVSPQQSTVSPPSPRGLESLFGGFLTFRGVSHTNDHCTGPRRPERRLSSLEAPTTDILGALPDCTQESSSECPQGPPGDPHVVGEALQKTAVEAGPEGEPLGRSLSLHEDEPLDYINQRPPGLQTPKEEASTKNDACRTDGPVGEAGAEEERREEGAEMLSTPSASPTSLYDQPTDEQKGVIGASGPRDAPGGLSLSEAGLPEEGLTRDPLSWLEA